MKHFTNLNTSSTPNGSGQSVAPHKPVKDTSHPIRRKAGARVDIETIRELLTKPTKSGTRQKLSALTLDVLLHLELKAGSSRVAIWSFKELLQSLNHNGNNNYHRISVKRSIEWLHQQSYITDITYNKYTLRQYREPKRYIRIYKNWTRSSDLTTNEKHIYLYILTNLIVGTDKYYVGINSILIYCHVIGADHTARRAYVNETINKLLSLGLLTSKHADPKPIIKRPAIYIIDDDSVAMLQLGDACLDTNGIDDPTSAVCLPDTGISDPTSSVCLPASRSSDVCLPASSNCVSGPVGIVSTGHQVCLPASRIVSTGQSSENSKSYFNLPELPVDSGSAIPKIQTAMNNSPEPEQWQKWELEVISAMEYLKTIDDIIEEVSIIPGNTVEEQKHSLKLFLKRYQQYKS